MTFRTERRTRLTWVAVVAIAGGGSAAARAAPDPPESPDEPRVGFQAEHLELDPRLSRLELRGNVAVTVDRYRLSSDHLVVTRGPLGVLVEGEGRVAFCPCPDPPVTLGFERALVAPPTDLLLKEPTLRVGGVPVLWLPYLWLRSPRRPGLLPLTVAYRGADGALIGSGVHVPIAADDLDVGVAVYSKGGVEVDSRFSTPNSVTKVRWDYLHEGLVEADLRGASSPEEHASVAWSLDALRGARALRGPVPLEEVALRDDRARIAGGFSDGTSTLGVTFRADALRGGSLGTVGTFGPATHLGIGGALGRAGTADADADLVTVRDPSGAATLFAAEHGEVRFEAFPGPFGVEIAGRTRAAGAFGDGDRAHVAAGGIEAEASLPFVKDFGPRSDPMEHWVTPFVAGTVGASDSSGRSVFDPIAPNGGFYVATAGVRSTVGELGRDRGAVSFSARGGTLGDRDDRPSPAAAFTAGGRTSFAALGLESVMVREASFSAVDVGEARLGSASGPFVAGRITTQTGPVPLLSRVVVRGWDAPWVPYLGAPGTSVGGGIGIPWTRSLATSADADYDVSVRTLLGVQGRAAYRHPCGCLAVTLWAGHRLGRSGFDSFLTVDLMPER